MTSDATDHDHIEKPQRRTVLSAIGLSVLGYLSGCFDGANTSPNGVGETAKTTTKESSAMSPVEDLPDGFVRCRGPLMSTRLSETVDAEKVSGDIETVQVTAGRRNGEPFTVNETVELWLASKCTHAAMDYLRKNFDDRLGGHPFSSGIGQPASEVAVPLAIRLYSTPTDMEPDELPPNATDITKPELVNQAPRTIQVTVPLTNGDQSTWPVPVYGKEGVPVRKST